MPLWPTKTTTKMSYLLLSGIERVLARLLFCMQDVLQAGNASQKYIQQMFRRQQPQAPAEKPSSHPQGMYLPCFAS